METLLRDLRYLLRSLRSSRAFSAVVVLTIAVAVGASTALFSVVDPLLLRAEPFADPGRLVALWESPPRADGGIAPGKNEVSAGTFGDWSAEHAVFDGVAAVAPWRPNLTGIDEPTRLNATAVSRDFSRRSAPGHLSVACSCRRKRRQARIPSSCCRMRSGSSGSAATRPSWGATSRSAVASTRWWA